MTQDHGFLVATERFGFMHRVYAWMAAALAITAAVAWYVAQSGVYVAFIAQHPFAVWGIFIAQFALVIVLTTLLNRLSYMVACLLFVAYACSLGVTLSIIFGVYTESSIAATFLAAAGMFGAMALYGYVTRTDLTTLHSILVMILFGFIIVSLINLWLQSSRLELLLSVGGVILFALLTAADTQKLKQLSQTIGFNPEGQQKVALIGALTLYLDFINLFLYLLRFMGNRKNQ